MQFSRRARSCQSREYANAGAWPDVHFNPAFSDVRLPSGVSVGAQLRFKLKGIAITATFAVVEQRRELTWVGQACDRGQSCS